MLTRARTSRPQARRPPGSPSIRDAQTEFFNGIGQELSQANDRFCRLERPHPIRSTKAALIRLRTRDKTSQT